MKIETLITKDDRKIDLGKFTVLVGPNNVGKSQTLRDIHSKMTVGINVKTTIIKAIEFEKPGDFKELLHGLNVIYDPNNINQQLISGVLPNLISGGQQPVNLKDLKTRQKNKWIVLALEALHSDKCSEELKDFVKGILDYMGEEVG